MGKPYVANTKGALLMRPSMHLLLPSRKNTLEKPDDM